MGAIPARLREKPARGYLPVCLIAVNHFAAGSFWLQPPPNPGAPLHGGCMGSVFGRRRRRRYVRRHRSRRTSVVALLIGSGFALIISVTHLALARSSLEAELRSEPA